MQNLQLADGGKRFLAYLIDIIILSIVSLILFGVLFAVGGLGVAASAEGGDAATAGMMAAIIGAGANVSGQVAKARGSVVWIVWMRST